MREIGTLRFVNLKEGGLERTMSKEDDGNDPWDKKSRRGEGGDRRGWESNGDDAEQV